MGEPHTDRTDAGEELGFLRDSWESLSRGRAPALFAEIIRAYTGPDRHYHNLRHIQQVLDTILANRGQARDLAALQWAAWFHDVVYDPRAQDNEERSAAFAEHALAPMDVPPEQIAAIKRLILDTKTHQPSGDDGDGRLFLDADLAILGAPEDQYNSYARAIRREYAWVPDPAYRSGRGSVLRNFLRRPRLYFTDAMFAAREGQARANLEREIRALDQSLVL
jgi:predicted metal-dependent HD superfamily phosphohydrolase